MAGPDPGIEGIAPVPVPAAGRPVRLLRRLPVPDPDVGPGAPAPRRLPAHRRGAPRLDGPVRRHACAPRAAPRLVPGQRPVDLHIALARAPDPPPRRPASGLARRDGRGRARRIGAGRGRQRRRVRPDAGGHGVRAPGPHRTVPPRGRADRDPHRRPRRSARDGRHRGAVHRPPDGHQGAPADERPRLLGDAWDGTPPEEGSREELELAKELTERFEALLGPEVEALQPGTVDPPGHPRRLRKQLTWLFLRPGRLDRTET